MSAGRSPLAISAATRAGEALSDRTPTETPVPSTCSDATATLEACATTPWDVTEPTFECGVEGSLTRATLGSAAIDVSAVTGTAAVVREKRVD